MNKKRLLSVLVAGLMLAAMLLPASADAPTTTITIEGASENSTYSAWRLLDLTTAVIPGTGDEATYGYNYAVREEYRDILWSAYSHTLPASDDDASRDAELIENIEGMAEDPDQLRNFADNVFRAIREGSIVGEFTATDGIFENVPQGYYLIAETAVGEGDAVSLVMLDTATQGDVTIAPKKGVPVLRNTIRTEDDKYVSAEFVSIGDLVDYSVGAQLPANISDYGAYNTYNMVFHIKPSEGLAVNADLGAVSAYVYNESGDGDEMTLNVDVQPEADGSVKITILNLSSYMDELNGKTVIVEYSAEVKEGITLGEEGNAMSASLEFSNDPYNSNSTSQTKESVVKVFSAGLTVNKIDQDGSPLAGAGFTLYKDDGGEEGYVAVKEIGPAEDLSAFSFNGLGKGKYQLVETTVPDGYIKFEDLWFEISADLEDPPDGAPALSRLIVEDIYGNNLTEGENPQFHVDLVSGVISTNVENHPGTRLPGTGGAGTYAIYGGGAALVAAGLAALVIKKRKSSAHAE